MTFLPRGLSGKTHEHGNASDLRTQASSSPQQGKVRSRTGRIFAITIGLVVALGAGTWLMGAVARSRLAAQHPAPGRLVDVGGYRMHISCAGEGHPTVVLDAGLLDFSTQWARVMPAVAGFTRVCAYDRAGLGWSEVSPHPRTSAAMVEELRALLSGAELDPPYVLVGHSFGGMNARLVTFPLAGLDQAENGCIRERHLLSLTPE